MSDCSILCTPVHVGWLPQYLKQASRYRFAPSLLFSLPFHLFSPLFLPFSPPHLCDSLYSSNAYDYDVFISTSSIGHITALHRSIISSLEVSLTDKQVKISFSVVPRSEGGLGMRQTKPALWWCYWVCYWTEMHFDINVWLIHVVYSWKRRQKEGSETDHLHRFYVAIFYPTFCTVMIIMHYIPHSLPPPLPSPSLQEHFTNFYNLSGVIAVLLKQLPDRVTEVKQSGEREGRQCA